MSIQYKTQSQWNKNLIDLEYTDTQGDNPFKGLVKYAVLTITGAPDVTAGVYMPGCIVANAVDHTNYQMDGTTASPSWELFDTGVSFSLPEAVSDSTTTSGTSFSGTLSTLTTGIGWLLTAAATTTGEIFEAVASAATLTTGRYFSANDGATEVFGIGTNGHIISTVSAVPPTIAVTTQAGITAAALTSGASDTCGIITTTGTSTGGTVITVTFGKTYTTAPKAVIITAANASGGGIYTLPYVLTRSATAFEIEIAASGAYGATPSWNYLVIA